MNRPRSLAVRLTLLVACLVFAAPAHAQPAAGDIDRHVARVMDAFDAPGVSLAIPSGTAGSSPRRATACAVLAARQLVDAQTLFGIASNTKVMTATARHPGRRRQGRGMPRWCATCRGSRCGTRGSRAS